MPQNKMDNVQPSAEELAAEQAAAQVPKEEEIRAEVIKEFGFDETADADKIDRLTKKEMESREKLSKAIGQKIKFREAAKVAPKVEPAPSNDGLSAKDALIVAKANVDLEDVDTVIEYAKFKNISVAEALKSPMLKGMLDERVEERKTAAATATGRQRQQANVPTAEQILSTASKGQVPDDDEGIAALAEARMNQKLKRGGK